MRFDGTVTDLRRLGHRDHVCWVYDDVPEFAEVARTFLVSGLERGERLLCVGEVAISSATEGITALPDAADLVQSGRLALVPQSAVHAPNGARRSAPQQLEFYSRAVADALADGFSGLRVAAEVTELAADPDDCVAQLAWEQVADAWISAGPGMATLCAYRSDAVDDAMIARLTAVHPSAGGLVGPATFRVYSDGPVTVLTGEVDSFGADRLADVLRNVPSGAGGVVLDLSNLAFVDGAGACVLSARLDDLAAQGVAVSVLGASPGLRRVWAALGLTPSLA